MAKIIESEPLIPIRRRWRCRIECDGEMVSDGTEYPAHRDVVYLHECSVCKRTECASECYPLIEYEAWDLLADIAVMGRRMDGIVMGGEKIAARLKDLERDTTQPD